jgi:hypothetical protein
MLIIDTSDEDTDTASEGEYSGTTDSASATESATEGKDIVCIATKFELKCNLLCML